MKSSDTYSTVIEWIVRFGAPSAFCGIVLGSLPLFSVLSAAETVNTDDSEINYQLLVRDQIEINIFDEPDLDTVQRIDGRGQVRLAHLGTIKIAGMTVREAEIFIEKLYVEERILRHPMATVRVLEYTPREIKVLGAVADPGTIEFPKESTRMDIVDALSRAGGFTKVARRNHVRVTRLDEAGQPQVIHVNVDDMISGKRPNIERVYVYPGDTIFIPESLF